MNIPTNIRFVDAYTGARAPVLMDVSDGTVRCSAPTAVSPRTFYPSMADARRALGPDLVCPYTGEALRPVHDGESVMFVGGWDPRYPVPRQAFLHFAAMRAGKSDVPEATGRVEPVPEPVPVPVRRETPVTQEAIDTVLEATERKRTKTRRRRK
jgi:hypothetical protein